MAAPADNSLPRLRGEGQGGGLHGTASRGEEPYPFPERVAGESPSPLCQDEALVVWQTLTLQNKTEGGLHG